MIFVVEITAVGAPYFDYFTYYLLLCHWRLGLCGLGVCLILSLPRLYHSPKVEDKDEDCEHDYYDENNREQREHRVKRWKKLFRRNWNIE